MKKISEINEYGFDKGKATVTRITVRGIIIKRGKVLLTYSKMFEDYMVPGGGVNKDEDLIAALKREIKEEVGGIIKSFKEIGYIETVEELNKEIHLGINYYYLLNIEKYVEPNREDYEIYYEMESRWVKPLDAINQNEEVILKRLKEGSVLPSPYLSLKRDNIILKYVKEHYL